MIKMVGSRGNGKTKDLIELAVNNNYVILSSNDEKLRRMVVSMGYSPFIVYPFEPDVVAKLVESNIDFVVDDIDIAISNMFNEKIKGFTLTL